MNIRTVIKYAAVAAALATTIPAAAQQSSVRDLADMASAAMDAAREKTSQAAAPADVKAIFAKAEEAAEDGGINFCGFHLGMSADEAKALAAHYGLKEYQWSCLATPMSKQVYRLTFTLRSIRRIVKGGNSFDELSQGVANRVGTMKSKHDGNYNLIGYEYRNIDGQTAFMSEGEGLVMEDSTLKKKVPAEAERNVSEASKGAIAKLASEMVPIPGKDYSICKYEVTQALWFAVMGENPSEFKGADRPVENVSWDDCQKFLEKLNALPEVKASGKTYRLPTADEWEFACRAGATGDYCKLGDGTEITWKTLGMVAWYYGNSKIDGDGQTHHVGQKKPNAFGLYDMHGNVEEWTSTAVGDRRVRCGGSWYCSWDDDADNCKAGDRYSRSPGSRDDNLGLRLAAVSAEQRAEAERKVLEASKAALAKLASDMVPIPGKDYSICMYEVTQALWFAVMGENPSEFKGADRPVENVSWDDCQKFLEKLNALPEVKASGKTYRLPTADEWGFACRAGATDDYCILVDGTEITRETLGAVAWFDENSDTKTHPVGQKKPNAFGLYDMHGNAWEWTSTADGDFRVYCGGSWLSSASLCWAGGRRSYYPGNRYSDLGLRLAAVSAEQRAEAERKAAERAEAERKAAERAEAERKAAEQRAEAERKVLEASKAALAKLSSDMVPIPGENYSICKYEVTQALWFAVMGENPSEFKGADRPVENVSWDDCQQFLEKLNALPEVKASGKTYRLPTADEWEFACRAGATGDYCRLADGTETTEESLGTVAWYYGNSEIDGDGQTHHVGQKKPNAFGLYDMHGNVEEWTSTAVGDRRVRCGGSWYCSWDDDADNCKAGNRYSRNPDRSDSYLGFRLAAVSAEQRAEAERKAAERAEAERKAAAEAERKAIAEASKGALAKLASDMVPIPGKDYSICKYEVTQALWEAVMGENPSHFKGADRPVEEVSWNDCQTFLEKLNALPEVKASGKTYRLPTADEWEFACRAGAPGDYCMLADGTETTEETLGAVAWFDENSDRKTHPVGQKKPNAFGLYDMCGNVWEWTSTADGNDRVHCGGSWSHDAHFCEAGYRDGYDPDTRYSFLGFRLAH